MTSPPLPPSPPSGPPLAVMALRKKEVEPFPPLPAFIVIFTLSKNISTSYDLLYIVLCLA